MGYHVFINITASGIAYPLAAIFMFILVFGDSEYKKHALILFLYFVVEILIPEIEANPNNYKKEWVLQCYVILQITGVFFLITLMSIPFNKLGKYSALILILTVITHGMMVTHLETTPLFLSSYTKFIYNYYFEIIILTYLAMLGVSYNGFNTAYINAPRAVQRFILDFIIRDNWRSKVVLKHKKNKGQL